MAIQDSDPDRRNLVLTSVSFIVFFLGEGEVTADAVRLQVVPVTFHNVEFLGQFCWGLLFWFAFRYWQTHRGAIMESYADFVHIKSSHHMVSNFISWETGMDKFDRVRLGFDSAKMYFNVTSRKVEFNFRVVKDFKNLGAGKGYRIIDSKTCQKHEIQGWLGFIVDVFIMIWFSISSPGFTSFVVPYLLLGFALFLGLKDFL